MNPLAAALNKAIGVNDDIQTVKHWLDTGFPPLNKAISNRYDCGFPSGRLIEMFGPESAGKTLIATKVMISAQQAGGIAAFMDHENSFEIDHAERLGLQTDPTIGNWIFKTPETFEESIDTLREVGQIVRDGKLIPDEAPIVFVYDSLASMVPQSTLKKAEERNMNDNTALARATSAHLPTIVMLCAKYNICCIFLNQVRMKMGVMFGDPTTTPGGNAPKFYASVRIQLGRSQIKEGTDKVGQSIGASVIKNKVSNPFRKCKWDYFYDGGLDIIGGTIDHLVEIGKLPAKAGYIEFGGKKLRKKQLIKFFKENGGMEALKKLLPKETHEAGFVKDEVEAS